MQESNSVIPIAITGVTLLAAVVGGGIILWLFQKPSVAILLVRNRYWVNSYTNDKLSATIITIIIELQNKGSENTTIDSKLVLGQVTLLASDCIELKGRGSKISAEIHFTLPLQKGCPKDNETLEGKLILDVWNNRRLLIGKRYLKRDVMIECANHDGRYYER